MADPAGGPYGARRADVKPADSVHLTHQTPCFARVFVRSKWRRGGPATKVERVIKAAFTVAPCWDATTRGAGTFVQLVGLALACLLCSSPAPARAAKHEACLQAYEGAQVSRLKGHFTEAREQLLVCAQSSCPAVIRRDCISWLSEVDQSLASVVFSVSDARGQDLVDVRVYANERQLTERIDGRAIVLDPGVYELRFEPRGHAPFTQTITVYEAQKNRLVHVQAAVAPAAVSVQPGQASAAPDPTRARSPYLLSYALAGGAVGVAALGTVLGVLGKREYDRLEKSCREEGCTRGERAQGKRMYIAADVSFAAAGGLGVAALWTYLATRKHVKADSALARSRLTASFVDGAYFSLGTRF